MPPVIQTTTTDAPGPPPAANDRPRWHRSAVIAGAGVFVAMVVFWALVFTGTLTPHNPDRLSDRAWAARSDATCKPVYDAIAKLPNAGQARSGAQRAATLDQGTALVRDMVAKLATDLPNTADGRTTVRQWLDDWRVYLTDRQAFADNLRREGGDAQPLFTQIHGSTAKQTVTDFADANSMNDCEAPIDM